jgi:hypothetical protein
MIGHLTEQQAATLAPFVASRTVMGLGAGALELANRLLALGARHVVAVDSHFPSGAAASGPKISCLELPFRALTRREDVVVMSYPPNWPTGLAPILADAEIVIYLGKNTDATACGDAAMWNHLVRREVLAYVPDRKNVLIIYGPHNVVRRLTGEERGAVSTVVLSYADAEAVGWRGGGVDRLPEQLALATVTENGVRFKTGVAVCFTFLRNEEPSPFFGSTYQQDIEPAGRYMILADSAAHVMPRWTTGEQCFQAPLVLLHNAVEPTELTFDAHSWKARLSHLYAATGLKLTRALIRDGYDGIVTVRQLPAGELVTNEIVALLDIPRRRPGRRG